MREMLRPLLTVTAVLLLAGPVSAMSVEEVIAEHVEAKGGNVRWEAIGSMKLTGTFTAFSRVAPFTLHRKRGHQYHMDYTMNEHTVVVGYDGETAWWDNHFRQAGARPITGEPDLGVVMREIDFATPFFDYEQRGFKVALIGETEIEGIPAIGLELTRPDETAETWYLDPRTYLEIARESPGSDFGRPMPQVTFYDDFRDVEGVKIPHLVESQWYTRHRVMQVEQVALNVDVEDKLFVMPVPTGMEPLVPLAGEWTVKVSTRQQPGAPWQESERETKVGSKMRFGALEEHFTTDEGGEYFWTLSYDRFKERYRYTQIDDQTMHLDVREGDFDEEGRLVLSNVDTGTTWEGFGMQFHTRVTFLDIGEDGFEVHTEISTDGGGEWFLAAKQEYRPKSE